MRNRCPICAGIGHVVAFGACAEPLTVPCPECAGTTVMISPEQAAMVTCTNVRAIYRFLEAGRVHYVEVPGGALLVCPDSILKLAIKSLRAK